MKKCRIEISTTNNGKRPIDAYVSVYLAAHRMNGKSSKWTVTHTPTGLSLSGGKNFSTKRAAGVFIASLENDDRLNLDADTQEEFRRQNHDIPSVRSALTEAYQQSNILG